MPVVWPYVSGYAGAMRRMGVEVEWEHVRMIARTPTEDPDE